MVVRINYFIPVLFIKICQNWSAASDIKIPEINFYIFTGSTKSIVGAVTRYFDENNFYHYSQPISMTFKNICARVTNG